MYVTSGDGQAPALIALKKYGPGFRLTAGFILTPSWLLGANFGLQWPQSHLRRGGIPFSFPQIPRDRPRNLKILSFSIRNGHFGPVKNCLETVFMNTEFRHLSAQNGRNSGVNARGHS